MRGVGAVALVLLAALLAGCAAGPRGDAPGWLVERKRAEFVEAQQTLARQREAAGDLPGALDAWHSIAVAAPGSRTAQAQEKRLQGLVEERFQEHVAAAKRAEAAGQAEAAELHWLAALASRPRRTELMDKVRGYKGERVLAALATTPLPPHPQARPGEPQELEYPAAEADAPPAPAPQTSPAPEAAPAAGPVVTKAPEGASPEVLEQALARLARAAERADADSPALDARIEDLRERVAEGYYRRGRALFRSDLDAAIDAFRLALRHDPEHARARQYLLTAVRLRERAEGGL